MTRSDSWPMQLDFAHVAGRCFIAYGWVAGLGSRMARARLQAGRWQCNLLTDALPVMRPDVTAHLGAAHASGAPAGAEEATHDHGFFVLCELDGGPENSIDEGSPLLLTIQTQAGVVQRREWPIVFGEAATAGTLRQHERAMRLLLGRQSPAQVKLLTQLFDPPLQLRLGDLQGSSMSFGPAPRLALACVLFDRFIVAGHLPAPSRTFRAVTARWYLQRPDGPRAIEADLLGGLTELPNAAAWNPGEAGEPPPADPRLFIATLRCPEEVAGTGTEFELAHEATSGSGSQRLALRNHPQDILQRLSSWLGTLDASNRIAACERILDAIGDSDERAGWREALIAQVEAGTNGLPPSVDSTTGPERVCLFLEQAVLVPGTGVLLAGWAYSDGAQPLAVSYHCGGRSVPVSARWVRRTRLDVQNHLVQQGFGLVHEPGFVCLVELPEAERPLRPAYLKVTLGAREWRIKVPLPSGAEPVCRLVRTLLSTVDPQCSELRRVLDDHVGRAVHVTWKRRPAPHTPPQRWAFGPQPEAPTVSLIVPLFGRNDLADHQLALFTDDPDLHRAELIYVMDDPSVLHEFKQRCTDLYRMHGLPFVLAYPGDNLGFAGATNHGAALARAPRLLLLNSDVFPREPGWLGRMVRRFDAQPDTGLLGVKLLYEDGSIQHAGMDSVPFEHWQGMWINRHPHKGLQPSAFTGVQEVPAVTAACVMIDTAFYRQLGGLSEDYIIGDFEDSDLCYRARQAGRVCRVDLDIALYHLERQSQSLDDGAWRMALTLYNCWVHDQRWGRMLQEGTL